MKLEPLLALPLLAALACGGPTPPPAAPPVAAPPPPPTASATASADVLGPRPETPMPATFVPPSPTVFQGPNGLTVWLLERHEAPVVACDVTVPTGASSDPQGKGGLAYVTANMLDEGAGKRGAIDLAKAIDDLGARIDTDANADAMFVSLAVLKRNLGDAFAIYGDVVARPRLEAAEFKRVKDLWHNELLARAKEPDATARVVYRVALFGPNHPYGHPWDGTPKSAAAIGLEDVKRFYKTAWRPDRATLVCAGDTTQAELAPLLQSAFGAWKAPATPAPPAVIPPAPAGPWPAVVLVDRADAPQVVVAVVRPGVAASSPDMAPLWRVNAAIGGSFTSRLNLDLRETHGYTYGAGSRYSVSRGPGLVVSSADVMTDKTGEAVDAMLTDLRKFADGGLTDAEVDKTRSEARADLVSAYEMVERISGHLAGNASLGLPADYVGTLAKARDAAAKPDMDALAKRLYSPDGAMLVMVGPKTKLEGVIEALHLPPPSIRDEEGRVVP
ncbi:MAG TPA: pitrilysin family protein [Polyangiaceae bacterium]